MGCTDSKDGSTPSRPKTTVVFSTIAAPHTSPHAHPAAMPPHAQRRATTVRIQSRNGSGGGSHHLRATCPSFEEVSTSPDLDGSGSRRVSASSTLRRGGQPNTAKGQHGTAVTYPHVDSAGVTHHSVESLSASYFTGGHVPHRRC